MKKTEKKGKAETPQSTAAKVLLDLRTKEMYPDATTPPKTGKKHPEK